MSTAQGHVPANASTSTTPTSNGFGHAAGGPTDAFGSQVQLLAAMQAQAMAASMLGQNPIVSNILGTNMNPFMTQFSSQNSQGLFTGMNNMQPMQPNNLFGAMLQQQQSAATQFNVGQLLTDAIKLSSPVGNMPDDEETLIKTLCESEKKGESYRMALEGLHGKNDHAANVWKDYYLEHHRRINDIVAQRCGLKRPGFAKRPKFDDKPTSDRYSPPLARPSKPLGPKVDLMKIKNEQLRHLQSKRTPSTQSPSPSPRRRSPSVERVPSRCPTPPTEVIPLDAAGRAARYTQADREYLISYSRWRLHQEPSLSRDFLAKELSEKVPHHSLDSWRRHISRRDKELDAVYEEARKAIPEKRDTDSDSDSSSEDDNSDNTEEDVAESASQTHRQHDEHESGGDFSDDADDEEDEEDENHSEYCEDPRDHANIDENAETDAEEDLRLMSGFRKPFNDADRRVMARYIASIPDWEELTGKDRWGPFAEMYPQRNSHAWAQIYRGHTEAVELEVLKYRRRAKVESGNGSPSRRSKRGRSEEDSTDESEDEPLSKRSRQNSDETPSSS